MPNISEEEDVFSVTVQPFTTLYNLNKRHVKCKQCRRKYSLIKLNKDINVLYHFYLEISARKTSIALGMSYRTVSRRFMEYRHVMAEYLREQFKELGGEVETDDSYFGGKRKGKRGRGAYNVASVNPTSIKRRDFLG